MAYVIVSFVVVTAITFVAGYLALRRTRLGVERFASATVTPAAGTILRFEPGSEGYWQRLMEARDGASARTTSNAPADSAASSSWPACRTRVPSWSSSAPRSPSEPQEA